MPTPIPALYQVMWVQNRRRHYGIVARWDPESINYYNASRQVIIEDAVTPERYVVDVDVLTTVPMSFSPPDEYTQYVEEQYRIAKAHADSLPDGLLAGKLFCVPRGDGYAHYIVTKVNKKTVDIEWRGYCLDRWADDRFGSGGREKRETIEMFVAREDARRRIFSS